MWSILTLYLHIYQTEEPIAEATVDVPTPPPPKPTPPAPVVVPPTASPDETEPSRQDSQRRRRACIVKKERKERVVRHPTRKQGDSQTEISNDTKTFEDQTESQEGDNKRWVTWEIFTGQVFYEVWEGERE